MSNLAHYRKYNDRSHSSSTYHKKDETPVRAILKRELSELEREYECYWTDPDCDYDDYTGIIETLENRWDG